MSETTKFDSGKDWTFPELDDAYQKMKVIADEFGLTYYPNQIEIITSEQMLDCYSAVGMPVNYSHWSFGKQFVAEQEKYKRGLMGLAYEIVINSSPCIAYCMEENTMMMQCLVIAHACFGHGSFFKNNVQFKQWTDAESIIDYLTYAKNYIAECEDKYGPKAVELVIDAAHSLRHQGVDRYKRPVALSKAKQTQLIKDRVKYDEEQFNDIWRTIPTTKTSTAVDKKKFPEHPEENLLYFIEKHAPNLEAWKREIIRIIRKIAQYFYPQGLTQVMNEGCATFWHYHIIEEMYKRGHVTQGFMLEFYQSHTGVVNQRPLASFNPYALGFAMLMDIKRICLDPTDEDREWFPSFAGSKDWIKQIHFACHNFKDESFIMQYLSPKVMRDMQMFNILDDDDNPEMKVEAIQNDEGYRKIREKLSDQQNRNNIIPCINVVDVDVWGDRSIMLEHYTNKRHILEEEDALKVLEQFAYLWGYAVVLRTIDSDGKQPIDEIYFNPADSVPGN